MSRAIRPARWPRPGSRGVLLGEEVLPGSHGFPHRGGCPGSSWRHRTRRPGRPGLSSSARPYGLEQDRPASPHCGRPGWVHGPPAAVGAGVCGTGSLCNRRKSLSPSCHHHPLTAADETVVRPKRNVTCLDRQGGVRDGGSHADRGGAQSRRLVGHCLTSHQRLSPHPGGGDRQESPAAAEEPGYVANAQTQALARSATGLIGLVVHDIADPYFFTITRGAQLVAREHGSQVLLAGAEREEQAELDAVAAFVAYRTKAIILAGSRPTADRPPAGPGTGPLHHQRRPGGHAGQVHNSRC